ncbi:pseudouridylate synthase 7 homolog isoform X2 [Patiria miniata]|uniref:Pseudouridylate synthase 7 homolog n=1 Tax=Patiria miniata TaxID=46514 RepID=A0A913ZQW2_PATMI|nr:pseudouridylate synthase 7 homolog isoform X2 [Patiria miniata]
MAERQSIKRDRSEEDGASEAEAKSGQSGGNPASKRVRVTEDPERKGSPVADSTTTSVLDDEVVLREESVAGDGQASSLHTNKSEPDEHVQEGEDHPSSTSGNQAHASNKIWTGTGCSVGDSMSAENCHPMIQSYGHCETSEAVARLPVEGDQSGGPCLGSSKSTAEYGTERPMEVAGSSRLIDAQSDAQAPVSSRDSMSPVVRDPGPEGTSQPLQEVSCEGDSAETVDGQGDADNVQADTATEKEPLKGLRETDVGIVEYISKHKGFHGVIKHRYQDFLVNEVNQEGQIVHLTDMSCPDPKVKIPINADEVLSAHDQQRLRELVETTDKKASHCIEVQDYDKEKRRKVHELIRQDYETLESCTLDGNGKKVIKVTKITRGGRKQRSNWDKSRPNYCRFVMHKENMEVNDSLTLISKYSHVKHQSFGFSGTKDKRAVTVQEVTVWRVEAERLCRLNSVLRGIRLGNFRYVKEPLTLGDHSGNHFVIVLRDVNVSQEEIDQALTSMRDVGFINYYGMQRFGNSQVATHLVGRAVLLSKWQEAVDLILKPREGNTQDNRWRQLWMDTRDAKAVMDILPKHKTISIEMQLLKALKESSNNYRQSLLCIPRNVRLLYVHSYQSYVWNVLTTRRIQKYGLKVIPGDLVLSKEDKSVDESEHLQSAVVDGGNLDSYSIHDIVLPLPGYAVNYPQNEVGDWYQELLHSDGLDIKKMRHQIKDFSLSGTYRKMLVKPANVSWSVVPYSDATIPLVQSDLDRLEGKEPRAVESDGKLSALRLEFTLSSSCYATMAIREVLKIDTSAAHQSTLNPVQQTEPSNTSVDMAEADV